MTFPSFSASTQQMRQAPEDYKPWIAATMGAIGKPANEAAMMERGKDDGQKDWATVAIRLIANPESLKFLARLPKPEQPDEAKVEPARKIYDAIMKVRATPVW